MESRQNRKLLRSPECRLKRFRLIQSLNNAHEQRPGVHIHTVAVRFAASPSRWCCVFTNWTDLQINTVFLL